MAYGMDQTAMLSSEYMEFIVKLMKVTSITGAS